jgi:hypothetical protein
LMKFPFLLKNLVTDGPMTMDTGPKRKQSEALYEANLQQKGSEDCHDKSAG